MAPEDTDPAVGVNAHWQFWNIVESMLSQTHCEVESEKILKPSMLGSTRLEGWK